MRNTRELSGGADLWGLSRHCLRPDHVDEEEPQVEALESRELLAAM
jgi:hypothetical protein